MLEGTCTVGKLMPMFLVQQLGFMRSPLNAGSVNGTLDWEAIVQDCTNNDVYQNSDLLGVSATHYYQGSRNNIFLDCVSYRELHLCNV